MFACFPAGENYFLEYFVTIKNIQNKYLDKPKFHGINYYPVYLHMLHSVSVAGVSPSLLFSYLLQLGICHFINISKQGIDFQIQRIIIAKCIICCYSFCQSGSAESDRHCALTHYLPQISGCLFNTTSYVH